MKRWGYGARIIIWGILVAVVFLCHMPATGARVRVNIRKPKQLVVASVLSPLAEG